MKLKSLFTLATVILLTAATALGAAATRTGAAKAAKSKAPQRIAAAAAAIPTDWVDMGEGEFTEDILTDQGGYDPPTYKVTVQKSVDIPGWYKIVNPFANNPEVSSLPARIKVLNDKDYEILIDATNPEAVVIPQSEIGIQIQYKPTYLYSMTQFPDAEDEFWLDSDEVEAMVGTFKDNVITFSVEESLVLESQLPEQTNLSGSFRLVLPEEQGGGEEPIIPDEPDDKLTVTIIINDPDFIKGIELYGEEVDLDFNDGVLSFKADEGDDLFIDVNDKDFKINSIIINGENSNKYGLMIDELEENTTIEIDVERYRDDLTATVNVDTPENVKITQGTGSIVSLEAGDNTITFSNKEEKSGKLTISAQTGCNILTVEQNGSAVTPSASGEYSITLSENDIISITTQKLVVKDPVVTITTTDIDFFEAIAVGYDEIDLDDFEDGKYSLDTKQGDVMRFLCYTDDYKVISVLVNGERKSLAADGSLEITVEGDMTIDFNVVAYKTFNATIKIDDPANAVVKQNGATLTLKAGENPITFTDKDPASAKLTIAKTQGDITITLNGDEDAVNYDFVNEYFTVTLKNEGDVVEITKDALPTANVTLKVNDPEYIIDVFADATQIDLDFDTDGVMSFEAEIGARLTISGDKDNFMLESVLVNGEKVNKAGPMFAFNINEDTEIEFVVVRYHDVEATISVDNAAAVKVTQGTSFGTAIALEDGDNTFTFSNKDANNGKITIAPQTGYHIEKVTLNDEEVEAQTGGTYTLVLAENDVLKIETAINTHDVTVKVNDAAYIKSIKVGEDAVELAFEEGAMTFEVATGSKLDIEGDNDNFKLNAVKVNDTDNDAAGPDFSFTISAATTIEFDVEAYRDVTATIDVDAPENVKVSSAEAALELNAGENVFTFNNKDAENGKVTIAAQEGCRIVSVTLNDNAVAAEDETYTVTLAEGDVLKIESAVNKPESHNVTIKANDAAYIKSITAGEVNVEPAFEDGAMTFEVADGSALVITGDNDNFELKSVSVDGQKTEAEGPEFKFTVTAETTVEFEVEAYRDVTATINVDAPENVKVTAAGSDEALTLNAGDNTFTFNNKDAQNGEITIVANEGFRILSVTLNDETVAAQAGAYVVVLAENDVVKITSEKIPVEDPTIRVTVKLDNPGAVIYSYTNADSEAQNAVVNAKENVFEAEVVKYPTFYATNGYVITSCVDEAGKAADIMYDGGAAFASYSQIKKSKTYTLTTQSDADIRDAAVSISLYDAGKVSVKRGYYDVYGLKDGDNTVRFKSGSKENEITISSNNPDEKIGDVLLNGESQRASGVAYTLTVKDGDVVKVLSEAAPVVPPVAKPVVTIKSNDPDFIMLIDVDTEEVDTDFTDGEMTFEVEKGSILTLHGDADNYKLLSVTVNGEKNTAVTSTSFRYTVNADLTVEFEVDRYRTLTATIDVDDPENIKVTKGGAFSSSDVTLKAGEQTFEFTNKDENSGKLTITAQTECRILSITLNGVDVAAAEFGVYKVTLAENDVLKITTKKIIRDKDVIVYRDDVSLIDDFTFRYSDNTHKFGFENGYTTVKFCDDDLPIHCSFQSAAIAGGTAEVYIDDELVDREEPETDIFSLNPDHNSVVKIFHNGPAKFHDLTFAVDENAGEVKATRDLVKPIDDLTATHNLHAGTKVEFTVEEPEAVKEVLLNDKPLTPEADNHYSFILNAPASVKVVAMKSTTGISDAFGADDETEEIYNLQGIRIFRTVNELPEGIYIINGKKVMISK